jgi:hypothetical protein
VGIDATLEIVEFVLHQLLRIHSHVSVLLIRTAEHACWFETTANLLLRTLVAALLEKFRH